VVNLIPEGPSAKCILDGIEQNCQSISSEAATKCPDNDCGPRTRKDGTLSQVFQSFADGWSGFLPPGAVYRGNGRWLIPTPGDVDGLNGGSSGLERNHASSLPQKPTRQSSTTRQQQAKPSDCADLVAKLVTYAMSGNLQNRQIDGPDPFYEVGVRVMREAGRPHDFHPMEGSGFKPELYANGQDSDVYLHIYGFAGGTILGNRYIAFGLEFDSAQVSGRTGQQFVERQLAQDRLDAQGANGHSIAGGETEVLDDLAGIAVGNLMKSAIVGNQNESSLSEQLRAILCK